MTAENRKRAANEDSESISTSEAVVIPVIEEEVVVGRRIVETGKIRVVKSTNHEMQTIKTPSIVEDVEVKRVSIDQTIEEPAVTREEGDVTIIPVMEEVIVVTKKLVLKEEIHLIRRKREVPCSQEIQLKKERVHIKKLKAKPPRKE